MNSYKRICVKPGCGNKVTAAFTYVYADSTIVIGNLPPMAEPDAYEICNEHVKNFIAPRGWKIIRLQTETQTKELGETELEELAKAIILASKKPVKLPSVVPPVYAEVENIRKTPIHQKH